MRYNELTESEQTKHYLNIEFGEDTAVITAPIVDVRETQLQLILMREAWHL